MTTPTVPNRLDFDHDSHTYRVNGLVVPSVTQLLKPVGFDYSSIPQYRVEYAAQRGTAVHAATEFYDEGDLDEDSIDLEILPYVEAWRLFREQSGFTVFHSEVRVYSERHGFAGTFDCLGVLGGQLAIVEKKTTAVLHPSTAIQVSAYMRVFNEGKPREEHVKRCYSVWLRRDGTYRLDEHDPETHWGAFLALRYPDHPQSAATVAAWRQAYL